MSPARSLRRLLLGALIVGGAGIAMAAAAWADDGPTPPQQGDPVAGTTDVAPHGGYSATSDMCLQCHSVHKSPANEGYALLRATDVIATCETCHSVGGSVPPSSAYDPGYGGTIGSTSRRAVYTVSAPASGHDPTLAGNVTQDPDASITISQLDPARSVSRTYTTPAGPGTTGGTGGLYCGSCHSPHGDKGNTVNTKKVWTANPATGNPEDRILVNWANGQEVATWTWTDPTSTATIAFGWDTRNGVRRTPSATARAYAFLHFDTSAGGGSSAWEICDTTTPQANADALDGTNAFGNTCRFAQVKDAEGQVVSLYAYKMLSSAPNHTYGDPVPGTSPTVTMVRSYANFGSSDAAGWCGTCHNPRLDADFAVYGASATNHNHPTSCTSCHGNEGDISGGARTGSDFPHTSANQDLLKALPDALCVSCHASGLP